MSVRFKTTMLGSESAIAVVEVLCEAFFGYPVMEYILDPSVPGYNERLHKLVRFFVMARVFRNEPMIGVLAGESVVAAAIVARSYNASVSPDLEVLRDEVFGELGPAIHARYRRYGETCKPFDIDAPNLHLSMIGTLSRYRGLGLGRVLLDRVHALSADDPESQGVTLTTEVPENVALYKYFGYDVVGEGSIAPGYPTWGFFRPDKSTTSLAK